MCNKYRRKVSFLNSFGKEASKHNYGELTDGKQLFHKLFYAYLHKLVLETECIWLEVKFLACLVKLGILFLS